MERFLVKVGGELYIPCNPCSASADHYGTDDVEPVTIEVNPKRPAFRYLRRLLGKMKNMGDEDFPTERTNLLYEKEENELDLDINSLAGRSNTFDFFVKGAGPKLERFQYCGDKKKSEKISVAGKPLGKKQKVGNVFENAKEIELVYVGSPGAELTSKDDYWVVSDWSEMQEEKAKKELSEKLGGYCKENEELKKLDSFELSVLLAVISSEYPAPVDALEVTENVKEMGHECPCSFEEYDDKVDEIQQKLEYLAEKGLLENVNGDFVPLENYRKQQFENSLLDLYSGLGHVAEKDIVSAAALLSLTDEPATFSEIKEHVDNLIVDVSEHMLERRLKGLADEGIVKESHGLFDVRPEYLKMDNPDQLSFRF